MAYRQYTSCIEKSDFDSFWNFAGHDQSPALPLIVWGILQGVKDALIGAIAGFLTFGFAGAAVGASIGFSYGMVDGFCDQWLNRRLICIKKDSCAIGKVAWIETPEKKDRIERLFDNDLSINLRLIPYDADQFPFHYDHPQASDYGPLYPWTSIVDDGFPAADLLKKPFSDLNYNGYDGDITQHVFPELKPNHPGGKWSLHCEFEGNAMVTLCTIGKALALLGPVLSVAGAGVGAVVGAVYGAVEVGKKAWNTCKKSCKIPIVCDVVCAIVTAVAAVAGAVVGAIIGAIAGAIPGVGPIFIGTIIGNVINTDGSFSDAANDPESGEIHPGDCVFIAGDLVYDAGHSDGWNEIHPVKHLQKICKVDQPDSAECCPHGKAMSADFSNPFRDQVKRFWDRWCNQYQTSQDPVVIQGQRDPENQWCLHPLVDGCSRRSEPNGGIH